MEPERSSARNNLIKNTDCLFWSRPTRWTGSSSNASCPYQGGRFLRVKSLYTTRKLLAPSTIYIKTEILQGECAPPAGTNYAHTRQDAHGYINRQTTENGPICKIYYSVEGKQIYGSRRNNGVVSFLPAEV